MKRWICLLGLVAVFGCAKKVEEINVDDESVQPVMDVIQGLVQAGSNAAAVAKIEEAMTDPGQAEQQPILFRTLLSITLQTGAVARAAEQYVEVIGKDALLESSGYGLVSTYYAQQGLTNDLVAWTARLSDAPWSGDLKVRAVGDYIHALTMARELDRAVAVATNRVGEFAPDVAVQMLDRTFRQLVGIGAFDAGERVLTCAEACAGDSVPLRELATRGRIELHFVQKDWAGGEKRFLDGLSSLQDSTLRASLHAALRAVWEAEQWDVADRLCRAVLDKARDRTRATEQAARSWVDTAARKKDVPSVTARVARLLDEGLDPEQLATSYTRHFYTVLGSEQKKNVEALLDLGDQFVERLTKENTKNYVRELLFDAAFVAEDYDRSLRLLQEGLPGRDDKWKAMAENKILAHKALSEEKFKEAAQRFRDFMKRMEEDWEGPQRDPVSGMSYSKEMTLGFNAARIGEILQSAGDAAGAKSAFEEARGYYQTALESLKPESPEHKYVTGELAGIPGAEE